MTKKLLFFTTLFFLVLNSNTSKAQQFVESWDNTPNLDRHMLTLNLINPGIRYELGLLKNLSLSTSINPGLAYYTEGYVYGFVWHTQVRFYHNFKQRFDANKNIMGNSANFVSFARSVFFQPLQIATNLDFDRNSSLIFTGPTYGFQRTNSKNLNITAELGYGYFHAYGVLNSDLMSANGHGAFLNLTVGWVPTNRKARRPIKLD